MFPFLKKDTGQVIHINDIDNLIGHIRLIDIREPYEVALGSIKSSKNIPMRTLLQNPDKYLDKNETYYIMCQSGARSHQTTKMLSRLGYSVVNVAGGFGAYVGTNKK